MNPESRFQHSPTLQNKHCTRIHKCTLQVIKTFSAKSLRYMNTVMNHLHRRIVTMEKNKLNFSFRYIFFIIKRKQEKPEKRSPFPSLLKLFIKKKKVRKKTWGGKEKHSNPMQRKKNRSRLFPFQTFRTAGYMVVCVFTEID